jgi:septum formation protein
MFNPKIYLASNSKRRADILKQAGYEIKITPSNYKENNDEKIEPAKLAAKQAQGKADVVALELNKKGIKKGLVIGADTIGVLNNKILGKPKDKEDAFKTLKKLSNRKHTIITGVCVINLKDLKNEIFVEETDITFKKITDDIAKWYLENENVLDKAASYAIQNKGIRLIKQIDGDFYNVIGLPLINLIKVIELFKEE